MNLVPRILSVTVTRKLELGVFAYEVQNFN
jgi:hypothetical protein